MTAPVLHARVDAADRLVTADPGFLALNARAGGATGELLALPPLRDVARIARRLAIPLSRRLTVGDGDADLDCWVRALPDPDGTSLTLSDLREKAAPEARHDGTLLAATTDSWRWQTDAALRLVAVDPAAARTGVAVAATLGASLDRLFTMPEAGSPTPWSARRDFGNQPVRLLPGGQPVLISGIARSDVAGAFAGYAGKAVPQPATNGSALSADFITQLDRTLRQPIGRIVARADSMNAQADGSLDGHYVDYAADIASAGRHLLSLIDDLADLQAIERPDFRVEAEPIDLADVARRAAGLLAVRAANAGVVLDRPAAEAETPATGEFRRTLQVLVNLIGNAVRFSPQGTAVTVSVDRDGDRAIARIVDRGRGIAPKDQARIFEKFVRLDQGEGGSGLGLFIARRLARAMGGDLTVESTPGEGACFSFWLPAR